MSWSPWATKPGFDQTFWRHLSFSSNKSSGVDVLNSKQTLSTKCTLRWRKQRHKPYMVCLMKSKNNQYAHAWVRNENQEKKMCQREVRTKKGWKEILSERKERRTQHAWTAIWDQLTNISATLAGANQHLSPEWPETVVMYKDSILSFFLNFSHAACQWERHRKWVNERRRQWSRVRVRGWTVGVKVKEREKKKDVDKKGNET